MNSYAPQLFSPRFFYSDCLSSPPCLRRASLLGHPFDFPLTPPYSYTPNLKSFHDVSGWSREETLCKVLMKYHFEVLRLSGLPSVEALNEAWKARPYGVQGLPMGLGRTSSSGACFLLIVEIRKGYRIPMSKEAAYLLGTHWIKVIELVNLYELHHPVCVIGGFNIHPVCSFSLDEHGLTSS